MMMRLANKRRRRHFVEELEIWQFLSANAIHSGLDVESQCLAEHVGNRPLQSEVAHVIDDFGDSANTATPVDVNTITRGNIDYVGDVDWFSFRARGGFDYRLETDLVTLDDSYMWLVDTDGQTILLDDDDSGAGYASQITWTAPSDGVFYVAVAAYSYGIGQYDLLLTETPRVERGDLTQDGQINADDIDLLYQAIADGDSQAAFDLNLDRRVDHQDVDELVQNILNSTYGDANLDGLFNSSDLVQVFSSGMYGIRGGSNVSWREGDWNGDGTFDEGDLVFAMQNAAPALGLSACLFGRPRSRFC